MKAYFKKYQLHFKSPARTSRDVMYLKNGYYLFITDGNKTGVGECSFIEGLSVDDLTNYESVLTTLCNYIESDEDNFVPELINFPSIQFGFETALRDFETGGKRILVETEFTSGNFGIPINGLVWMGDKDFMMQQIVDKIKAGFHCIKLKVGAIDFEQEIELLKFIRQHFNSSQIEIRLDANGAFDRFDVFEKMKRLSDFGIHSIEQPVRAGQSELMEEVCNKPAIPVALDEELILLTKQERYDMLHVIRPQYIILKPSLLGGFEICNSWLEEAEEWGIGWWYTSALESNIGLNAIAQWVSSYSPTHTHGLGTGGLYTNNIESPLFISKGELFFNPENTWGNIPVY
jgi:o-succinylbenzoate synthase